MLQHIKFIENRTWMKLLLRFSIEKARTVDQSNGEYDILEKNSNHTSNAYF